MISNVNDAFISPKSAGAWLVKNGQYVTVIDLDGEQVADLVAFNPEDHLEYFSQSRTRSDNWTSRPTVGNILYSNRGTAMFTIMQDDVGGVHDILALPCSVVMYREMFQLDQTGCREHLSHALSPYSVDPNLITDPFNVFMNSEFDEQHELVIRKPRSRPGDRLVLRSEGDWLLAVSACAAEVTDCNAGVCTSIGVEITDQYSVKT